MAECDACGQTVIWRNNEGTGKKAPIDPEPTDDGNIIVVRATGAYRVLTKAAIAEMEGSLFEQAIKQDRYKSHFATCPKAGQFRRCGKCHRTPCQCREKDD